MKTVAEIEKDSKDEVFHKEDNAEIYAVKPEGMSDETVAFIIASSVDEVDDWGKLLEEYKGLTKEQIVKFVYAATAGE